MSKKIKNIKKYTIKKVTLDPLYKSYWYSKFLNKLMLSGKKHIIEKIMSQLLYQFKLKYKAKPILILFLSIIRLKPLLGTISKRVGSNWKTVPVPLAPRRQLVLALKWLVSQIKVEPEKTLKERITRTFNSLVHKESKKKRTHTNELFSKKKKQYRQAVLDRTNTRFRWI